MKPELLSSTLIRMVNHRHLRKLLAKRIDDYVYKSIVENACEDIESVRLKRYQYLSAMLRCMNRNMDKGYVSGDVIKKIIDVFVQNNLVRCDSGYEQTVERYKKKYGEWPPTFIVLSPTQKCNLQCIGCYASSAADTAATIPYNCRQNCRRGPRSVRLPVHNYKRGRTPYVQKRGQDAFRHFRQIR